MDSLKENHQNESQKVSSFHFSRFKHPILIKSLLVIKEIHKMIVSASTRLLVRWSSQAKLVAMRTQISFVGM